jgi:hypothetical protein
MCSGTQYDVNIWKSTEISEEYVSYFFNVEDKDEQDACTLRLLVSSCWFLAWITLRFWRKRPHVPLKRRLTFNELNGVSPTSGSRSVGIVRWRTKPPDLNGVISQKREYLLSTAAGTSKPTQLYMYLPSCIYSSCLWLAEWSRLTKRNMNSDLDLFQGTVLLLAWRFWRNPKKVSA